VWLGFCTAEVAPSPKLHDQAVGLPEDVSVKVTVSGAVPLVGEALKLAAGGATDTLTQPPMVLVFWPLALLAVSATVYVPAALYVWFGFCWEEVLPSPKLQDQAVGPPEDVSVNATVSGDVPLVGKALKLAETGTTEFTTNVAVARHCVS
jgi:hypothetical protein